MGVRAVPDSLTNKLLLKKPAREDNYDVLKFNFNADAIDAAIGFTICTSGSRPSTPWQGQHIYETDTGSAYVRQSTNWIPIVTISCTSATRPTGREGQIIAETDTGRKMVYIGGTWVDLGLQKIIVGNVGSNAPIKFETSGTIAGNRVLDVRKQGEANATWTVDFNGLMQWGAGGASAMDITVSRGANGLQLQSRYIPLGLLGFTENAATVSITNGSIIIASIVNISCVAGRRYKLTSGYAYDQTPPPYPTHGISYQSGATITIGGMTILRSLNIDSSNLSKPWHIQGIFTAPSTGAFSFCSYVATNGNVTSNVYGQRHLTLEDVG